MYTNVKQHCNCQSQNNFSTLNITLILASSLYSFLETQVKCLRPYDVIVALDKSAKVAHSKYDFYIKLIKDVIHLFNVAPSDSHFAMVSYNDHTDVSITLVRTV